MKYTLILILFSLIYLNTFAQISHGGKPLSLEHRLFKKSKVYYTKSFNYQKLINEDKELSKSKKYRFGKTHNANISPENYGSWETLQNGDKVWKLEIHSENAFSVGLLFNIFKLNKDVKLFVYSTDNQIIKGAFTSQNNKINNKFSILPVKGDKIIIELNVPANMEYGELNISGIVHDYKGIFKYNKLSGACNININCTEGDDWQDEKRAVTKYLFTSNGYTYSCTGALINNTAQDDTPYLLTANHCISTSEEAESATFIFNYESATCLGTSGSDAQSISIADLIATDSNNKLDFSLLKLSIDPPSSYNAYFAGWNRKTAAATNTVCIHHPDQDIKKISLDYDAPITGDYGEGLIENSHWKIIEWDKGTTEGGSSGSPLFDQNHLIVGDLTGGDASCSYNYNDYYSKFDMSWDYYSAYNEQLKYWLDPLKTNPETLNGKNQNTPLQTDAKISYIFSPKGTYCNTSSIIPKIIIQNKGSNDLTSLKISYKINNGTLKHINWTGNLQNGEFENILLEEINTEEEKNEFKVFSSLPNGIDDMYKDNDTTTVNFEVIEEIDDIEILGDKHICLSIDTAYYYIENTGNFSWNVSGGEIINSTNTSSIDVVWEENLEKKVYLTYTNACSQQIIDYTDVIYTEHNIVLNVKTIDSEDKINYTIKDLFGNTIINETSLTKNQIYNKIICLETGCYSLSIYSSSSILEYSLANKINNKIIISSGSNTINDVNLDFCLIHEDQNVNFRLYPNPANDKITIVAKYQEMYNNASFSIYNLKGAKVIPETTFSNIYKLNISELMKGTYIIRIKNDHGNFSERFIKL